MVARREPTQHLTLGNTYWISLFGAYDKNLFAGHDRTLIYIVQKFWLEDENLL